MNFEENQEINYLIEKAKTIINYNNSLIADDVAVAMLGIASISKLKTENEELEIFLKVLNNFINKKDFII